MIKVWLLSLAGIIASAGCSSVPPVARTLPAGVTVVDVSQVDSHPVATFQPRPHFPESLRTHGARGEAILDLVVGPDGLVYDVKIVRHTHAEMADAAVAAVRQWRFRPGMAKGQATWTRMRVPIVFAYSQERR